MSKKTNPKQVRNAQNSRIKILAAAEAVFSEKGFDGARVDEIAKRAGINKALLYYYFKSKEQLLRALTEKHFAEMSEEKRRFAEALSPDDPDFAEQIGKHSMELFIKRRSFLRIIAIEAIKNEKFARDLSRIIDSTFIPNLNTLHEKAEMDSEKLIRLKMNIFFFGFAPILLYLTVGENWSENAGLDKQTFEQWFMEDFRKYFASSTK